MLTCGPRLAKLVPRLASDQPGEVVATVAAIRRTLAGVGLDLNDWAREIEARANTAAATRPTRARRERAPLSAEELRLLRVGLRLDVFSTWEVGFAETILTAAGRPGWRPSRKQTDITARLISKAAEAEVHP